MPTSSTTQPVITMEMIAERCGVHCSTVQRALKFKGRISERTAERIRAVAAEMGYDPAHHQAASRLIALRHGNRVLNRVIALYLPTVFYQHNYYLRLLQGILDVLVPERFDLLTTCVVGEDAPLPFTLVSGGVDGVIAVVEPQAFARPLAAMRATPYFRERPVVSLIHEMPGCAAVVTDDYRGGYSAGEHLLALGHRELLLLAFDERDVVLQRRVQGIRDACRAHRLADESTVRVMPMKWNPEETAQARFARALAEALEFYPRATAFFVPNDTYAPIAMQVLAQHGRQVPDDVSVVGFDDTDPLLNAEGRNILTTVRVPLEDVGREAARLIVHQVLDNQPLPETPVVLPTALVARTSTAPPAGV